MTCIISTVTRRVLALNENPESNVFVCVVLYGRLYRVPRVSWNFPQWLRGVWLSQVFPVFRKDSGLAAKQRAGSAQSVRCFILREMTCMYACIQTPELV